MNTAVFSKHRVSGLADYSKNANAPRLTSKETYRFKIISEVAEGYLRIQDAAFILGLSQRQIYRLKKRLKQEGLAGIIHRSRGRKNPRWLTSRIRKKVNSLYNGKCSNYDITRFTEFLNQYEKIRISRESVRQILLSFGSYAGRKGRPCRNGACGYLRHKPVQYLSERRTAF